MLTDIKDAINQILVKKLFGTTKSQLSPNLSHAPCLKQLLQF